MRTEDSAAVAIGSAQLHHRDDAACVLHVSYEQASDTIVLCSRGGPEEISTRVSRSSLANKQRRQRSALSAKYYRESLRESLDVIRALGGDFERGIEREFLHLVDERCAEGIAYLELWSSVIVDFGQAPIRILADRSIFRIPRCTSFLSALTIRFPGSQIEIAGVSVPVAFIRGIAGIVSWGLSVAGAALTLPAIATLVVLRRSPHGQEIPPKAGGEFCGEALAYCPGSGPGDPVLQYGKALKDPDRPRVVYTLGQGREPLPSERASLGKAVVFVRPVASIGIRFRGVRLDTILLSLVSGFRMLGKLRPGIYQIPEFVVVSVRTFRALQHARWIEVKGGPVPAGPIVISRCMTIDVIVFSEGLRSRYGVRTVHFLHGIIQSVTAYSGPATIAFCRNRTDAELIGRKGNYAKAIFGSPARDLPAIAITERQDSVLVLTNILTSSDSGSRDRLDATIRLLQMVAESFPGSPDCPVRITWRPHPYELGDRSGFRHARSMAARLHIECDRKISLREQIDTHQVILSTWSGAIGDALCAGRLPAVYFGFREEDGLVFDHIPEELRFEQKRELIPAVRATQNRLSAPGLYERMNHIFNTLAAPVPQPGYFLSTPTLN